MKQRFFLLAFIFFIIQNIIAQSSPVLIVKDALQENRVRLYNNLVNHAINNNLSTPLTDNTEENWMDAFHALELTRYKSPWVEHAVRTAFDSIQKRSVPFKTALLSFAFSNYPTLFTKEITKIFFDNNDEKVFALSAEYLAVAMPSLKNEIIQLTRKKLIADSNNTLLQQLFFRLTLTDSNKSLPGINAILHQPFYNSVCIVYSFQRKNRDYPGLTIVRDSIGNFVKDSSGVLFSVPQLARSITNLPGYLSNGNTPEGIFRMKGFAISKSNFIGPTPNIQLTMPFETSIANFLNDSSITETVWTIDWYKKLLPESWKNYYPVYGSYYAGKAGRTEIIAHGTTVDPQYYQYQPYFPLTPTLGCLSTKELWSTKDGSRLESDQQKLVDAIKLAGGANGYYIVIELDNAQMPVQLKDIEQYLK